MLGKRVKVRYDAYDANVAYAYVGGLWHKCFSSHPASFMGRSEKVIMLAAEELRAIHKQTSGHRLEISSAKLAAHLRATRSKEIILQQEKDAALEAVENGSAYSPISLPAPTPVTPAASMMPASAPADIEAYPEDSL
jgi:putative transposase